MEETLLCQWPRLSGQALQQGEKYHPLLWVADLRSLYCIFLCGLIVCLFIYCDIVSLLFLKVIVLYEMMNQQNNMF